MTEDRVPKGKRALPGSKTFEGGRYTQINILFSATEVDLPSADRFSAYPPEAQKAILAGFQREQMERHLWFKNQQANDHALNLADQRHYFIWRLVGTLTGGSLTMSTIGLGAWLVAHGAGATGVSMLVAAAAGLIGTAIYGHKAIAEEKSEASPPGKDRD